MHGIIHTSAWAYTYVRVSLHVRPRELTRTYVWNEGGMSLKKLNTTKGAHTYVRVE